MTPTTVVIVDATGDLAKRKLVPARYYLSSKGRLPENLRIVGSARSQHTDDSFRDYLWEGTREVGGLSVTRKE